MKWHQNLYFLKAFALSTVVQNLSFYLQTLTLLFSCLCYSIWDRTGKWKWKVRFVIPRPDGKNTSRPIHWPRIGNRPELGKLTSFETYTFQFEMYSNLFLAWRGLSAQNTSSWFLSSHPSVLGKSDQQGSPPPPKKKAPWCVLEARDWKARRPLNNRGLKTPQYAHPLILDSTAHRGASYLIRKK